MAQYVEEKKCNDFLCKEKIHDGRDLKLRLQQIRKEIGGLDFQTDPTYVHLTRCKGVLNDNYMSKKDCDKKNKKYSSPIANDKDPALFEKYKAMLCRLKIHTWSDFNQAIFGMHKHKKISIQDKIFLRDNSNTFIKLFNPNKLPTRKDCGYSDDSPKAKTPSPKKSSHSPSNKKKRCPPGTRKNKKTGNCDKKNKSPRAKTPSPKKEVYTKEKCDKLYCKNRIYSNRDYDDAQDDKGKYQYEPISENEKKKLDESFHDCNEAYNNDFKNAPQSKYDCGDEPDSNSDSNKKKRCPPGSRRNKKTGNCDKKNKSAKAKTPSPKAKTPSPKAKTPSPQKQRSQSPANKKRCPPGSRRNKKTGNCDKYK